MVKWKVKKYKRFGWHNLLHYFNLLYPLHCMKNGDFEKLSIFVVLHPNFIILS